MKKTIIILLVLLTVGTPIFAAATATAIATSAAISVGLWVAKAGAAHYIATKAQALVSLESKILCEVGDVFNLVTIGTILNLHPFPASFMKYYNIVDGDVKMKDDIDDFSRQDLISSKASFTYDEGDLSRLYDGVDPADKRFLYADRLAGGLEKLKQTELQLRTKRVGIITSLFAIFLTCEVIFYLIWGYVTGGGGREDGEEFPLKTVFVKLAYSIAIFFVLLALPYLIEMSRYAFSKLTQEWFGINSPNIFVGNRGNTYIVEEPTNVLRMPGSFIKQMAFFLDFSTPSRSMSTNLGSMLSISSKIEEIIMGLTYLIFSFFMAREIIMVALHILLNIIEVYVLLTIVMFLIPFSLFTPLKTVGEKSLNSLIGNLVECFVILILVTVFVPVVNDITASYIAYYDSLSDRLISMKSPVTYEIKKGLFSQNVQVDAGTVIYYANRDGFLIRFIPSENLILNTNDEDETAVASYAVTESFIAQFYPGTNSIDEFKNAGNYAIDIVAGNLKTTNFFRNDKVLSVNTASNVKEKSSPYLQSSNLQDKILANILYALGEELIQVTKYATVIGAGTLNDRNIDRDNVKYETRDGVADILSLSEDAPDNVARKRTYLNDCHKGFLTFLENKWANDNGGFCIANQAQDITQNIEAGTEMFTRLIFSFVSIFIPCYFVKNSSMITNALMSGTINQWGHLTGQMARDMKGAAITFAGAGTAIIRAINNGFDTARRDQAKNTANDKSGSPLADQKNGSNYQPPTA